MSPAGAPPPEDPAPERLVLRHLRLGWLAILVFLTLGLTLEALHGFKVAFYLDVVNETRRLMFTLAHAHGTLLGLLHLGFAFTLRATGASASGWARAASPCLSAASVLMPAGFLLGGAVTYGGDPGRGVLLVPLGGLALFVAVLLVARNAARAP
jgi:hypothetical protein